MCATLVLHPCNVYAIIVSIKGYGQWIPKSQVYIGIQSYHLLHSSKLGIRLHKFKFIHFLYTLERDNSYELEIV